MGLSLQLAAGLLLAAQCLVAQAQFKVTLIERSKAWGSATADYNGDGHDDIYIAGHDHNDRIWYWTPSGYTPSVQVLPWSDRHDCDAADVNLDGRIDIYCAVGADKGKGDGINELWMQNAAGQHELMSPNGAEDPYGRSRIPRFFDFNHDGYPDIYLSNYAVPRDDGQPNLNRVFVNQAGAGFVEATTLASGPVGSICVEKGDIDGDGWDDLAVCDDAGPAHLYLNNRAGDFIELPLPGTTLAWTAARLADMNGDGRDDLVLLTANNRLQIWFNSGAGSYFETLGFDESLPSVAASVAVLDLDHDGLKDLYVVLQDGLCEFSGNDLAADRIYQGQPGNQWLRIKLKQQYAGCGHLADVLDGDKVLLLNGGGGWIGPNYVIQAKGRK